MHGVKFLTLTFILTSSVSLAGLNIGVSVVASSKLPVPLIISQSIELASAELRLVKVADNVLGSN